MTHFAIEAILCGKKTVEMRFSKRKIAPYGQIGCGDLVYMKPPGEEVVGEFRVKKVFFYGCLTPEDSDKIFKEYGRQMSVGDKRKDHAYQAEKIGSRFGTLIFIANCERYITAPIKIKKKDLRGWVVLN